MATRNDVHTYTQRVAWLLFPFVTVLVFACSGKAGGGGDNPDGSMNPPGDGGNIPGTDGGNTPGVDGGNTPGVDGGALPPGCGDPEAAQCNNCIDDDDDGLTDGEDPHCISAADDDESSFATGIPGDNVDPKPDCFFDGNSGSGNDGCEIALCCLLGDCPQGTDCTVTDMCIAFCAPATPVGCDCFGCCTVCNDDTCKDILTIPGSTPQWDCDDLANLGDPNKCPECTKIADCSSSCDEGGQNADCVLCPGQSPEDLPDTCNMENQCPGGRQVCSETIACPGGQYCATGCCIDIVIE